MAREGDSGTRVRVGKGSRNGSAREDRVPHAPGPTRSSSMTGSRISLRIGLRPGSVLHLLHGFPGRGVWRLGSGVQGHGVTTVPSSLSQHRGPACPPAPGLLASRPRSPLKLIPEPVMLPGALLPACPGSCPLLPYRVPRPGAGFRQCALARGAQETATGGQSRACQLPSGRDQGGREGGTSPPANGGGFLGHGVRGSRVGPAGSAVGGASAPRKEAQRSKGTSEHRGGSGREGAAACWPRGQSGSWVNCSWAEACLAINDLGAGSSPQVPDHAGREEWPGSGGLESEVGTLVKQLDRGVQSSRETDLGA